MTPEAFKDKFNQMLTGLLKMARDHSTRPISGNCLFILSEIKPKESHKGHFNKRIPSAQPRSFEEVYSDLVYHYIDLYDINLLVFKAYKRKTIIEIQYLLKSTLDKDYQQRVQDSPSIHSKVRLPVYAKDNEKFDINWEFGGLGPRWNLLRWKFNYYVNLIARKTHKTQ